MSGRARHLERRQRAKVVAVAGYSIETPRLLLNSTSGRFPHGVANNEDQVGRYVMVQGASQSAGRFPTSCACTKPHRRRCPPRTSTRPTLGGASPAASPSKPCRPCPSAGPSTSWPTGTGVERCASTCATTTTGPRIGVLNELLPQPDNRVTLAEEKDPHGLPVARFDYSLGDNDKANIAYSTKVITDILHAAGAQDVLTIQRYAHLIGGARMGTSPDNSVVDANQRIWGVPNLFISDGSVCPTQGAANPALTIMALASRLAERMISGAAMSPAGK